MSLTSQLKSDESLFMRFALSAIPNSAAVTAVKDGSHRGKIATANSHDGRRPDWGLIGISTDYRLRLTFSTNDPVPQPARAGHALLFSAARPAGVQTLLADLTAAIATSTHIPNPGEADEIELIRLCVVAARLVPDLPQRALCHRQDTPAEPATADHHPS